MPRAQVWSGDELPFVAGLDRAWQWELAHESLVCALGVVVLVAALPSDSRASRLTMRDASLIAEYGSPVAFVNTQEVSRSHGSTRTSLVTAPASITNARAPSASGRGIPTRTSY